MQIAIINGDESHNMVRIPYILQVTSYNIRLYSVYAHVHSGDHQYNVYNRGSYILNT